MDFNDGEEELRSRHLPVIISSTGGGRYRECLKNHAVSIGGHAVDGCGEFMAAGAEGTLDALRCAACSCHRNFHYKEPVDDVTHFYRTPAGYLQLAAPAYAPAPPLALPSTSGGGCGEAMEEVSDPIGIAGSGGSGKKRFRTKFSQEQKERMLEFAERVGWRIQKQDEAVVQQFCSEAMVKRHVLKVWMHNNKHTLGKKPASPPPSLPPPS